MRSHLFHSKFLALFTFLSLIFLLPLSLHAESGTVRGRVLAPDASIIPGAKITLSNPITGRVQTAASDAQGAFAIYNVPFNPYILIVESKGFMTFTKDIDVRTNLAQDLGDIKLELAGANPILCETTIL